jgi:hypothetical protein
MASKKNKTFADQAKTIMSKYALRPNDNASKAAMDRELGRSNANASNARWFYDAWCVPR